MSDILERGSRAINLLEWGIVLLKGALLFAIGAPILILFNRIVLGFICLGINWSLLIAAQLLRIRARKIYPEGEWGGPQ